MIKANELRIGNWVNRRYYNPHPKTPQYLYGNGAVDGIKKEIINIRLDKNTVIKCPADELQPIPLSPELLEKCGFQNKHTHYWMAPASLLLSFDHVWWWTNSWESDEEFGYSSLSRWVEITHLHQLQNLYFALTGSEIEVNL